MFKPNSGGHHPPPTPHSILHPPPPAQSLSCKDLSEGSPPGEGSIIVSEEKSRIDPTPSAATFPVGDCRSCIYFDLSV
jgi:hypothetical protein